MTVSEVTSNSAPIPYLHQPDRLTITLPAQPKRGERKQVTVRYHGIPAAGLRIGTQ